MSLRPEKESEIEFFPPSKHPTSSLLYSKPNLFEALLLSRVSKLFPWENASRVLSTRPVSLCLPFHLCSLLAWGRLGAGWGPGGPAPKAEAAAAPSASTFSLARSSRCVSQSCRSCDFSNYRRVSPNKNSLTQAKINSAQFSTKSNPFPLSVTFLAK